MPTNIQARDLQTRLERGDAIQLVDVREDAELSWPGCPTPWCTCP